MNLFFRHLDIILALWLKNPLKSIEKKNSLEIVKLHIFISIFILFNYTSSVI